MHRDHFLSSGVLLMIAVIQQLRSHFNLNHDMSINNYLKAYLFSGLTLLNSGLYLSFMNTKAQIFSHTCLVKLAWRILAGRCGFAHLFWQSALKETLANVVK